MGNVSSIEAEDDLAVLEQLPPEEAGASDENLLDFSPLFVIESLHKALLNIKDPPGSPLDVYRDQLVKWLDGRVDKSETTVNLVQFVDFLTGKGSSKEQAIDAFGEMDTEGEGTVDVTFCLSVLKRTSTRLQDLLPCPHLPNLVDIYCPEKSKASELAKSLLQYLIRYRVASDKLVLPALNQINGVLDQRRKLVTGRYLMLEERKKDEDLLGEDVGSGDDSERMIISKCYSKVSVSTSEKRMENLFDSSMETYWQSNGSPKSHWIRLHLLPGVMVKELAVSVRSSDDSYMPKAFTLSVGNSESSLKEVKTINVPRHTTGRLVLVRNLSSCYSYIQINIKGCHSDGCDCRIRGLHIKGCKYKKEVELTVLDTMAIWYLNIIASTAKAAMPLSPHLRDTIIAQSKTSLQSLRPLSLSPSSPIKPEFFSTYVISEMDKFLTTLCLPEENFVSVDSDPLHVLLSFALAHGNVNTILDTLQILLDNQSLEFSLQTLLQRMEEMKKHKRHRHAEHLRLELVSCDGGNKDDDHAPRNMLVNQADNSADPYISESGKKVVNVIIREESSSLLELTNIKVKVQASDQGARAGLVFVVNSDPEKLVEQTEKYNDWTLEEYVEFQKQRSEGTESMDDLCPVAYFEPDKESREAEFPPDVIISGKYVMFKFLGSKKEDVERIGVHSITLYGHRSSPEGVASKNILDELDAVAPLPNEKSVCIQGGVVLIRVLSFLATMLKDLNKLQQRRKAVSLDPTLLSEEHLSVQDLSLEKVWNLYIPLTLNPGGQMEYASILCLHVLKAALPFIKPTKTTPPQTNQSASSSAVPQSDPMTIPSAVLSHLCGLLDSPDTDAVVRRVAQDIIVEGVVIFFPDSNARKEYLLNMIGAVLEENQPNSWWLKFEALCHYFSKTDSNSVLSLPKTADESSEVNTGPALSILTTMLAVATKEGLNIIQTGASKPDDLVKLLCALQASMFFWCKRALASSTEEGEKMKAAATVLLCEYVGKMSDYCVVLLKELDRKEEITESLTDSLIKSLLGRALPEMLIFLSTMVDTDIGSVDLLNKLHPLVPALSNTLSKAPSIFLKVDSKEIHSSTEDESVVGVWTRESPHNYENNSDKTEEFVCSSANKFVIEFDTRCHTERRYDYLEFTDGTGVKTKFDGECGSDRWAKKAEFKGQRLRFQFHSDSSNNEWGYKFTMKAYGTSPPAMNWLFDLQLSLSHLLGLLASSSLVKKRTQCPIKSSEKTDEQKEEEILVDSDLWKTLFRGGYMVGKLTRSLSGAYAASPADSALSGVLQDLANGPEGVGLQLLEMCRAETKGHFYGGPLVDKAVNSVFAALIWHSQDIREGLLPIVEDGRVPQVTPGLLSAFKAAEAMRRDLVEARQKQLQAKEKEEDKEAKEKINEDAPVVACHKKALFLLKFSGLSRVKDSSSSSAMRPNWAKKGQKWQKVSNAVSTVGVLKQTLHESTEREKVSDRYPAFELVLNFVKNESLSVERLHALLQQRSKVARSMAQTYYFVAEVVRMMGVDNLFELPGLSFLQQVLAKQKHFPRHYAAQLDGCGLDLENQVRKSYKLLLNMLLDTLNAFKNPPTKELSFSRFLVLLFLSHLLDFEWQEYDHSLLSELQLPEFLFSSAVNCSVSEDREAMPTFAQEEEILKRYEIHMELLKQFNDLSDQQTWKALLESPYGKENYKETHLFLVAISYNSDKITIQCDNCDKTINGRWYRDIDEEEDFDLCVSCFNDGIGKEHNSDHSFQSIGRYGCDDCHMSILSHRFHSNTRDDFDLCLGCFRKEQATGKTDAWTVYFLTEQAPTEKKNKWFSSDAADVTGHIYQEGYLIKTSPSNQLRIYVLQHCWILFSSLCLAMANTVNSNKSSVEVDYLQQACKIKLECLKLLSISLRAAVLDKLSTGGKKKSVTSQTKLDDKPDEAKEKATIDQSEQTSESVTVTTEEADTTLVVSETPLSHTDATPTSGDKQKEEEEEDPIVTASKKPQEMDSNIGFLEKSFSSSYIDNILGLLAAVLPQELTLSAWIQHKRDIEVFLAEELLPSLLQLSCCSQVDSPIRLQALLIAAQYFARLNPQVADRAVEIASGNSPLDGDVKYSGLKTVQFFFTCGTSSLKRSDFEGASTAESCLLLLSRPLTWRSVLTTTIGQCLKTSLDDMDLESVFGLLVLAGFPRVPHAGSILTYTGPEERPSPLVLTKVQETGKGVAVNLKTRENVCVNLSDYEIEDSLSGCIDSSKLSTLLPLIKASLKPIKQESERSVENMWILGLLLKALQLILQTSESGGVVKTLLEAGLVPAVVKLASRPTNFSQKWRLTELEVLGISVYQPAGVVEEIDSGPPPPTKAEPEATNKKEDDKKPTEENGEKKKEEEDDEAAASPQSLTQTEKDAKIIEDLPEDVQSILMTLSEVFVCKMPILRAMHDSVAGDMEKFMAITEQSYKDGEFSPSDEILEAAKKWETDEDISVKAAVKNIQQNLEDTGVTRLVPLEIDIKSVEATPEDSSIFKKTKNLMKQDSSKDKSVEDLTNSTATRQESYSLLKDELSSVKSKPQSRENMFKTFQAIAVLQARRVLASLLEKWPKEGARLSTTTLGCVDMTQYFCLLDLLVKQDGKEILSSVLDCAEPTEVISLAMTAVQCMSEVSVGKETKEIKYKQGSEDKMKDSGKVVVPNASSLTVTFLPVNGTIKFSSSEDLSEHSKCHTSSTFDLDDQQSHVIPGDTVYYEVEMAAPSNKNSVCSFTVNGTQMGRFDTGHSILRRLLCEDVSSKFSHCLPLSQLWPLLIAVACKYTGSQRLSVVKLLMTIVNTQSSNKSSVRGSDVVVVSKDRLELSALKPLWQLYTTLIKMYEEKTKTQQMISPEIIRVFTELFLCVENLAEEWGISQDLMIRTQTKEELHTWLEKGISNVAYLSIGLGLDNLASKAFIDAKRNYVPPPLVKGDQKDGPTAWGGAIIDTQSEDNDTDSFDTDDDDSPDDDTSTSDDDSDES